MTDTLAYHKDRPLLQKLDLADARLKVVLSNYDGLRERLKVNGNIHVKPETEALWFYVQNHAMQIVGQRVDLDEPLGAYEPFVKQYHKDMQLSVLRMFYYLLLICIRESRHAKSGPDRVRLDKKYPKLGNFRQWITDDSETQHVAAMLKHTPDVSLGECTSFLVDAFDWCDYDHSYGGSSWKKVAVPLRDFVHGKIPAEIMMDTAFTLAHNNGPIFNKGMLFDNFDTSALTKILDVQRSGQIPQLTANHSTAGIEQYVTTDLLKYVQKFSKLSNVFASPVDWTIVKDIGGSAVYYDEIKKQNYAEKQNSALKTMTTKAKNIATAFGNLAEAAAIAVGAFEIMPGVFVAKNKRSLS